MSKVKNIWFLLISFSLLLPSLVFHAYLGSFSRFLGDDYCSAFWANRFGVIRATWYWYITWSGRYSASALDSIFGILGPKIVPFVTPSVIVIWLITIGLTVNIIIPLRKNKVFSTSLLATGVLFLTLNFTPTVQQSLYWGQGMRSVVPPLILGTAYSGIFFALKNTKRISRKTQALWYLLSFLLAFGTGGFSETYCAVQLVAFGFSFVVLTIYYHHPIKSFESSFLIFGLLGAILSFIVVILAPGNVFRAAYYPPHPYFLDLIEISTKSILIYFANLFSSLKSATGFSGIFFLSVLIGFKNTNKLYTKRNLPVLLVGGLLLIFSCFPPAAYAMSDSPPGRTLIISTYIFAILIVFSGFYLGSYLSSKEEITPRYFYSIVSLLFFLNIFMSSFIISNDMYTSRHMYIDYAAAWEKTHNTLVILRNSDKDVVVPAVVDEWSGVLRMADNPRFYVNICVSEYYGLNSIVARDDLLPTRP